MQLLKDPQSSNSTNDDVDQSRGSVPSNSSDRPSRDLMCLVSADGTVRTIDPEAGNA